MQSYDLVSKTWSNGTNIITASNGYFYNGFKVHANANFVTSVAVGINTNAVTEGKAYFATLKNSVPDPQSVISVNTVNQGMGLDGVYTNADGSAYVLISGKSDDIARVLHVVGGAAVETTPLTGLTAPSWEAKSAISSGGTFFSVVNRGSQSPQAITHVTATLPVATGTPSITGKATTGKTLTARIPTFGGISGAGVAQVQWYSCTTKTTGVQTSVPAGCVAIAKATAAKYKVTTKVKKKYLGFAVKSTNFAGTTLLFAGVQSKAK
jgi:hypothetical protein